MKEYLIIFLFLIACSQSHKWEKTAKENTISAYEKYIQRNPMGEYISEAKNCIETLEWHKVKLYNTTFSYSQYLDEYPYSIYTDSARIFANHLIDSTIKTLELSCKINTNLSVNLEWNNIEGVVEYKVYSSSNKNYIFRDQNYIGSTNNDKFVCWSDNFPTYYGLVPILRDGFFTRTGKPTKICTVNLFSSYNGTKCQLCGDESIGYCYRRHIYVCSEHRFYTDKQGANWQCP